MKQKYTCLCCKQPFEARAADRARGWARYCTKSCKAKVQEKRTGQYAAHKSRADDDTIYDADMDGFEDASWDAHKEIF